MEIIAHRPLLIMQKQDTHSPCTSVTKIDESTLPISIPHSFDELTQNQASKETARLRTQVALSEEDERARTCFQFKTPKKCYNQLCSSTQIYRKVKSRVDKNRYRFLCYDCCGSYTKSQFCEFCEQIYGKDTQEEDLSNWVGCDNCERWNHITCQIAGRGSNFATLQNQNNKYYCLRCVNQQSPKQVRNGLQVRSESLEAEYEKLSAPKLAQPKFSKVKIEWKKDQFLQLEAFLKNVSQKEYVATIFDYRLQLSEDLIKFDLNKLRQTEEQSSVLPKKN